MKPAANACTDAFRESTLCLRCLGLLSASKQCLSWLLHRCLARALVVPARTSQMFCWCPISPKPKASTNEKALCGAHPQVCPFPIFTTHTTAVTRIQSEQLAQHLAARMPAAGVAALCATLAAGNPAHAADFFQQPAPQKPQAQQQSSAQQTMDFQVRIFVLLSTARNQCACIFADVQLLLQFVSTASGRTSLLLPSGYSKVRNPISLLLQGNKSQTAPAVSGGASSGDASGLPEGNQWRYSEFINAVQRGKVERVRFAKDGTQLQLTAVDGAPSSVHVTDCPSLPFVPPAAVPPAAVDANWTGHHAAPAPTFTPVCCRFACRPESDGGAAQ